MSLAQLNPIAFIPTTNFEVAREFYEYTLGLHCVGDDGFALIFRVGPANLMLRVVLTDGFTPKPYTIFGWEVENIHATVGELAAKGVDFLHFDHFEQSPDGVWSAPGGASVAWFKDLDGNVLSLSQHKGSF
jgi:catechol 2,3-dioxygenase-like lactoylglutathione lyase family enzyme